MMTIKKTILATGILTLLASSAQAEPKFYYRHKPGLLTTTVSVLEPEEPQIEEPEIEVEARIGMISPPMSQTPGIPVKAGTPFSIDFDIYATDKPMIGMAYNVQFSPFNRTVRATCSLPQDQEHTFDTCRATMLLTQADVDLMYEGFRDYVVIDAKIIQAQTANKPTNRVLLDQLNSNYPFDIALEYSQYPANDIGAIASGNQEYSDKDNSGNFSVGDILKTTFNVTNISESYIKNLNYNISFWTDWGNIPSYQSSCEIASNLKPLQQVTCVAEHVLTSDDAEKLNGASQPTGQAQIYATIESDYGYLGQLSPVQIP